MSQQAVRRRTSLSDRNSAASGKPGSGTDIHAKNVVSNTHVNRYTKTANNNARTANNNLRDAANSTGNANITAGSANNNVKSASVRTHNNLNNNIKNADLRSDRINDAINDAIVKEEKKPAEPVRRGRPGRRFHRFRSLSRRKKILIGMIAFLIFLLFLLSATLNRYNGYSILLLDRYISFDMPDSDTLTEEEWDALVESATVKKYPQAQLNREIQYITSQYKKRIKEYGLTYNEYLEESGITDEEFQEQIETLAKENVKEKLVLRSIAREKGITISSKELKEAKKQLMKDRGAATEAEYKSLTGESIDEHADEIDLESKLLYAKIVQSDDDADEEDSQGDAD